MQILLSSLKNGAIVAMNAGRVGELGDIIIDPVSAQISGFFVKTPLFSPLKIIVKSDIIMIDRHAVLINNPDNIVTIDEVIRLKEIICKKFKIINLKAQTENKLYLGHIEDIVIDNETIMITKYYLRNLMTNRIISAEKLIGFKNNYAVFCDDCAGPMPVTEGAPA